MSREACVAYLFEAKGIQNFILAGGKLVDIAGGSTLIAQAVCSDENDLLQVVLDRCLQGPNKFKHSFSRRAGAAFMIHFSAADREKFDYFRALWRLVFANYAPGVAFTERLQEGASHDCALHNAYGANAGIRYNADASLLPLAGPLVARSPRTGLPGVARFQADPTEVMDVATQRKRVSGRKGRQVSGFLSDDMVKNDYVWPVYMEADDTGREPDDPVFPFHGEDRRIGIVHADLSGLGQLYDSFNTGGSSETKDGGAESSIERREKLANTIEDIIKGAAQDAASAVLKDEADEAKALPGRPILLGGDDLTIIVRADLAIAYATVFLEALEMRSKGAALGNTTSSPAAKDTQGEGRILTACAGIAFGRYNQPFARLLALAEDLCSYAKSYVKAGLDPDDTIPSAIAFHRQTTSLIEDDMASIIAREATTADGRLLTAQPYLVGKYAGKKAAQLPTMAWLHDLAKALADPSIARGRPRKMRDLLLTDADADAAGRDYKRWREILRKTERLGNLDKALDLFGIIAAHSLPFTERTILNLARGGTDKTETVTPLFDALELIAIAPQRYVESAYKQADLAAQSITSEGA